MRRHKGPYRTHHSPRLHWACCPLQVVRTLGAVRVPHLPCDEVCQRCDGRSKVVAQ